MEADPVRRKICKVPNCGKNVCGRGFCSFHYHRWFAGINVLDGPLPRDQKVMKMFESIVPDENGCKKWNGTVTSFGYGRLWVNRISYAAHRYFYAKFKGDIPEGLVIDHLCRVRSCVNPDHLEAVTFSENVDRGILGDIKRKSTCHRGHVFDGLLPNTQRRRCSMCAKERMDAFKNKDIDPKLARDRQDRRNEMDRIRRAKKKIAKTEKELK